MESGHCKMGDPWPKKKAGIFSGVAGRESRAAFHSSGVVGTAGAERVVPLVDIPENREEKAGTARSGLTDTNRLKM